MIITASKIIHLANVLLLAFGPVTSQTDPPLSDFASAKEIQSRKSIEDFWTPERLRAAKEYIPEIDANITVTGKEDIPKSNDPQVIVLPSSEGDDHSRTNDARSTRTLYLRTTGRVFWSCSANQYYSCSASVIASDSRNLIVTAGHCVFDSATLQWFTNCNWNFIPGYSNGNAPYGRWTANSFYSFTQWTNSSNPDYNYDVAFVVMNQINGNRIADAVGYQGLYFNAPYFRYSYSFGYPVNINNGQTIQFCASTPVRYNGLNLNGILYRGQALRNCRMTGGCSGGPWLQQFTTGSGSGYTYSVNSFTLSGLSNVIFGPMFDSIVQTRWNQVKGI